MEVEGNPDAPPPLMSVGPEPCSAHMPYILGNTDDTSFNELPLHPPPSCEGHLAELGNQNITPVVEPEEAINVGHEFESAETAMEWYNDDAKKAGFSIKIGSSRKNVAGVVCWKSLTCSKEGKTNKVYRKKHKELAQRSSHTSPKCLMKCILLRQVNRRPTQA